MNKLPLDDDPLLNSIRKRIVAEIEAVTVNMASNGCKDIEDYRKKCGQISAYKRCLEMINEAAGEYVNAN